MQVEKTWTPERVERFQINTILMLYHQFIRTSAFKQHDYSTWAAGMEVMNQIGRL